MIRELLTEVFDPHIVAIFLLVSFFCLFTIILAATLDLFTGVARAKRMGVYRSSRGLRKTIEKLSTYSVFFLIVFLGDSILAVSLHLLNSHILPVIPYLSLLEAGYVVFCEYRSIVENTKDGKTKETIKGAEAFLRTVATHYGPEQIKKIIDDLTDKNNGETTQNN